MWRWLPGACLALGLQTHADACPIRLDPYVHPRAGSTLPANPTVVITAYSDVEVRLESNGRELASYDTEAVDGYTTLVRATIATGSLNVFVDNLFLAQFTIDPDLTPSHITRLRTHSFPSGAIELAVDSDAIAYRFEHSDGSRLLLNGTVYVDLNIIEDGYSIVALFSDGHEVAVHDSRTPRSLWPAIGVLMLFLFAQRQLFANAKPREDLI